MKRICILVFLLLNTLAHAQNNYFNEPSGNLQTGNEKCGFDEILNAMNADSSAAAIVEQKRAAIRNYVSNMISTQNLGTRQQTNSYVIPVAVHLIGQNTCTTITDLQVINLIALLNDAFSNALGSTYGQADDAQIKFCLAQTPDGLYSWSTTNGITRTSGATPDYISDNHVMDYTGQQQLAGIIYFNPARYLNIWVVDKILEYPFGPNTILGYSPFPITMGPPYQYLDGVVMRSDVFGIGTSHPRYNQGRLLAHEVGHYLGLLHTFHNGCTEITASIPCNIGGDGCCDTPPVAAANQNYCPVLSGLAPNSCGGPSSDPDMYENHMDYAYDDVNTCRNTFTEDQADYMHAVIALQRSLLVSYPNLLVTGVTGCAPTIIDPTFIANGNNTQFCTGTGYGFDAGAAAIHTWTFPGGTPSTSALEDPTGITWSVPGTYTVEHLIDDGSGNTFTATLQVFVSDCTPVTGASAQWYFGSSWSVNFSSGIATAQTPCSLATTIEPAASVCNSSGQLLFYTDGRDVWRTDHSQMPLINLTGIPLNGSPNSPTNPSSGQGVVIVPRPGNSSRYYIYTTSDINNFGIIKNGISQYEVDITLSGGLGDLLSVVPVHPTENYATTEPIAAIPHCNGTDYWIVSKPTANSSTYPTLPSSGPVTNTNNVIHSYLVNNSGIAASPVVSNAGNFVTNPILTGTTEDWMGTITVSPDKKFIAFSDLMANEIYLYYFDCQSGLLNYITELSGNGIFGYAAAFSPNSKVLYVNGLTNILQYDLSNLSLCNTNPPLVSIPVIPGVLVSLGAYQLGPDGRIYLTKSPVTAPEKLACINFPNEINSSPLSNECGYNFDAISTAAPWQYPVLSLPNDIIGMTGPNVDDFSICVSGCDDACFTNLGCGTNFSWDFGDGFTLSGSNSAIPGGTHGGATTGNYEYPCHSYSTPGVYTVTLSIDAGALISHTVTIGNNIPTPTITGTNPVCTGSTLPESYTGGPIDPTYTYTWNPGVWGMLTSASYAYPSPPNCTVNWNFFPATLTLTITDDHGCTNSSFITVTQTATLPTVNAGPDVLVCTGGMATINASASNGSISWSPSTDLSCTTCASPVATPPVLTTYTITASNGCGSVSDQVDVLATPTVTVTPAAPVLCSGGSMSLTASGASTYIWSPATGLSCTTCPNPIANPLSTTTYTVVGTDAVTGCNDTVEVTVTVVSMCSPPGTVTYYNTPTTLSAMSLSNGVFAFNADINISGIVNFTSVDINIAPGKTITVLPGATLNIDNSYLHGCVDCGGMWKGIVVNNTGKLHLNFTLDGNRSIIADAVEAVTISGGSGAIPQFKINGTLFNVNSTAFKMLPHSGSFSGQFIRKSIITGRQLPAITVWPVNNVATVVNTLLNQLLTNTSAPPTQNLITGSRPDKGIDLQGITNSGGVMIGWANAASNMNVFDNLNYGIYTHTSNVNIYNNKFMNFQMVVSGFTHLGTAIYSPPSGNSLSETIRIGGTLINQGNIFSEFYRGIVIEKFKNVYIKKNLMENSSTSVLAANGAIGGHGIIVNETATRLEITDSNRVHNCSIGMSISRNATGGTLNPDFIWVQRNRISTSATGYTLAGIILGDVVTNSTAPNKDITIGDNLLKDVQDGINVTYIYNRARIFHNEIRMDPTLTGLVPTLMASINVNSCEDAEVKNNTILRASGTNNTNYRGIRIALSTNNKIFCNTITQLGEGISVYGASSSPYGPSWDKGVLSNTINYCARGFVLSTSGVIGNQGDASHPTGFTWTTSPSPPGGYTYVSGTTNANTSSKLYGKAGNLIPGDLPSSNHQNATPGQKYSFTSGGLNTSSSGNALACPTSFFIPLNNNTMLPVAIDYTDYARELEVLLDSSVIFPYYNNETHWMLQQFIFKEINGNAELLNNPVLNTFYTSSPNTILGKLWQVRTLMEQEQFAAAELLNNSSTGTMTVQTNEITMNKLTLKKILNEDYTYTETDLAEVKTIALQCPLQGGRPVYQARNLLMALERNFLMFEDNCEGMESVEIISDDNEINYESDLIKLYPNPNSGTMTLEYNLPEDAVMVLTDASGRLACSKKIPASQHTTIMDCTQMVNGIYLYKVTVNDQVVATGKVVINK